MEVVVQVNDVTTIHIKGTSKIGHIIYHTLTPRPKMIGRKTYSNIILLMKHCSDKYTKSSILEWKNKRSDFINGFSIMI
jgi:hypothetical protein